MRLDRRDRRRLVLQDRRDQRWPGSPLERLPPGRHLVEHAPEREDVACARRPRYLRAARAPCTGTSDDRSLGRQRPAWWGPRSPRHRRRAGAGRTREAEVEELGARLGEHDVAGLEIAVDEPLPVRLVERIGDLDRRTEASPRGEAALRQPLGQRLPFESSITR